jgi:hypothetical protein
MAYVFYLEIIYTLAGASPVLRVGIATSPTNSFAVAVSWTSCTIPAMAGGFPNAAGHQACGRRDIDVPELIPRINPHNSHWPAGGRGRWLQLASMQMHLTA